MRGVRFLPTLIIMIASTILGILFDIGILVIGSLVSVAFFSEAIERGRPEPKAPKLAPIEKCRASIRQLETEYYGCVVSGSLVTDQDVSSHDAVIKRIDKELAPPPPARHRSAIAQYKIDQWYGKNQLRVARTVCDCCGYNDRMLWLDYHTKNRRAC